MSNVSRENDLKDLEERQKNNGKRPYAREDALGCMFHLNKNCGCSRCRNLKDRATYPKKYNYEEMD